MVSLEFAFNLTNCVCVCVCVRACVRVRVFRSFSPLDTEVAFAQDATLLITDTKTDTVTAV